MKKHLFTFLLLLSSTFVWSQDAALVTDIVATSNYWITLIVGVLLAITFQLLLTALSVAVGVTAVGDIKKIYVENKYSQYGDNDDDDDSDNSSTNTGVMITSGFGIWSVITTAIALFASTYIALGLTPIRNDEISIILSLAIWASFFLILLYLEGRMISTVVGNLISTAVAGLKASGQAIQSMFSPSPTSQVQNVADNTIEKLRQEVSAAFDNSSISDVVDRFINKVDERVPNYDQLKSDVQQIVSNNSSSTSPATWTAIQGVVNKVIDSSDSNGDSAQQDKAAQLKRLANELKQAYEQGNGTTGSVKKVVAENTSLQEQEVEQYINKIKSTLQSSTPEGLDTARLQKEITSIVKNPGQAKAVLSRRWNELDRDTIVEVLNKNTSLEKSKIENYADTVEGVLTTAKERLGVTNNDPNTSNYLQQIEDAVSSFFNGTGRRELNYAALKNDFQRAINNPNDSLSIIKARLDKFDRETLTAVLTNNSRIDRKDIDKIVAQVEGAKEEVSQQISQIEDKARSTARNMERRAVLQAEATRKTAMSAAWWLVATLLLGASAAIGGGMIVL